MQDHMIVPPRVGEHDAPVQLAAAEFVQGTVRHDELSIRTDRGMIPAHGGQARNALILAGVAVVERPCSLDDGFFVRVPSGVSPLRVHVEEPFLLEAVADEPLAGAGLLAARVTARGQGHLEENTLQVRTEHWEENGRSAVTKALRK